MYCVLRMMFSTLLPKKYNAYFFQCSKQNSIAIPKRTYGYIGYQHSEPSSPLSYRKKKSEGDRSCVAIGSVPASAFSEQIMREGRADVYYTTVHTTHPGPKTSTSMEWSVPTNIKNIETEWQSVCNVNTLVNSLVARLGTSVPANY